MGDKLKYINTVLLTLISIILLYGVSSISKLQDSMTKNTIKLAVVETLMINASTKTTNIEKRLDDLEDGNIDATTDRITKSEALQIRDEMRIWVEKRFERKK